MAAASDEYKLTDKEKKEFKDRFNSFDENGDGSITRDELGNVEREMGLDPTQDHLDREFSQGDFDGDGKIDFEEFTEGMEAQKERDLQKTEKEIKNTFALFDKNEDGFIDEIELKQGFDELGIVRTDEAYDNILKSADTNGDGLLSYSEFYNMVLEEADKTSNSDNGNNNNRGLSMSLDTKYIDNQYSYIAIIVLAVLLVLCVIRAVYKHIRRRNAKVYHALTVITEENDDREDKML